LFSPLLSLHALFSTIKLDFRPISIIEAMASEKPIVCSKNRGHNSLIENEVSGLMFVVNHDREMINHIITIYENKILSANIAKAALRNSKKYALETAVTEMGKIYKQFM
jgi:glycosyltransferase involved in cell wall biosynthesis